MSCSVPANQPIYQALLDKAASYPADKPYQAKAYKKAAESVLNYNKNFYDSVIETIPGIGQKIEEFIDDFVANNPLKPTEPDITFPTLDGAAKAMDDARKAAAAAAPKDVTTWPKDDDRTAFQAKVAASNAAEPSKTTDPVAPIKPAWSWSQYFENLYKPVVYTAENPRRSKRLLNKPKVQYFTKEDEQDEIAEAIEAVCAKKGWTYSDDLLTEFETWLPTAGKYSLEKYDYKTDKYIPRSKPEVAKEWAMYYSTSLQKQQKEQKLIKGLINYCKKNYIEYQEVMGDKFAAWMADPANKKLITYTFKSGGGCDCSSCNPNGIKREVQVYTYNRGDAYCINKWFSTLKKTIVW